MTADTQTIIKRDAPKTLNDHNLFDVEIEKLAEGMVLYEKRPAKRRDGSVADGLLEYVFGSGQSRQFCEFLSGITAWCRQAIAAVRTAGRTVR